MQLWYPSSLTSHQTRALCIVESYPLNYLQVPSGCCFQYCSFLLPTKTQWPPWWLRWYRICLHCGGPGFSPCVSKIPWRRKGHPLQFLAWRIPWTEQPGRLQSIKLPSWTQLTFSVLNVDLPICLSI